MSGKFIIRNMESQEVQIALDWAGKEGWNPGLHDADCFYKADPRGVFIGFLDGEPIAVGAAVAYDEHFGFCGLYIVKPGYRGRGYGLNLTHERLNYLGNRTTGLDGVLDKVSKYERLGYVAAHKNTRYEYAKTSSFTLSSKLIDLKKHPFEDVEAFDRHYFPAPRSAFLRCWINEASSYALGYVEGQTLLGIGVMRKCMNGYKIGQLFAKTPSVAQTLMEGLFSKTDNGPIFLDVPEINQDALSLVSQYKMKPCFEVIRMYRNGAPTIDIQGVYGITTFELG